MRTSWLSLPVLLLVWNARLAGAADHVSVPVELGPIARIGHAKQTITLDLGTRPKTTVYDVQDDREHNVRGISLAEFLTVAKAPKAADTVLFVYADGMEIPVRLRDRDEVNAVFIALEHGNVLDEFSETYALHNKGQLPCPKVVYSKKPVGYTIWRYPTQLSAIRLVTWRAYEARLAQPTRALPDRSGWPLYLQHCQSCHSIGGQGARRGPDFLGHMEAYRRVPPLAVTDRSEHPSLHEKIKGYTDGTMPVLNHIPTEDVATLWRWLHAIHRTSTK